MAIDITKMSSKGQIVLPLEMRGHIKAGEKIVVIQAGKQIILEKMDDFSKNIEEDLKFARRVEAAYKSYERGEFITKDSKDFLKELESW